MSRTDHREPAAPFNPRRSDDIYHRLQSYAEARARRNGRDAEKAGRKAMALYRLILATGEPEPNIERIVSTVAGEHLTI